MQGDYPHLPDHEEIQMIYLAKWFCSLYVIVYFLNADDHDGLKGLMRR